MDEQHEKIKEDESKRYFQPLFHMVRNRRWGEMLLKSLLLMKKKNVIISI